MELLLFLHFMFMITFCSAMIYPTLNEDDVVVSDVTSHTALLTWPQEIISKYNSTDTLRLFVVLEINNQAQIYMSPDDNNTYCSLRLSQCHLKFLTSGTRYDVVLTIDDYANDSNGLLGEAKVTFVTEATPSRVCSKGDNSRSVVLLFVVLPISGGFNFLLLILACYVIYRWRKRQRKVPVQLPEILVTNNNTRATQDYQYSSMPSSNDGDSSYTPMNLNSPRNQRLVVQSQTSVEMRSTTTFNQPQNLYENERARSGDSTALYANASLRGSRHNNVAQPQQQHEQPLANDSNKGYNIYVNECFPRPPQAS